MNKQDNSHETLFVDTADAQAFSWLGKEKNAFSAKDNSRLNLENMNTNQDKKLFVIDGLGILFKSFYGARELTNHRNENIAGIRGFILQIIKMIRSHKIKHMIVALDSGKKTWRHLMDERYKSNRSKTPEELVHQFAWIREACEHMGIQYCDGEECEADDWIASIAETHSKDAEIYIVSADKDLCQLVNNRVFIYDSFSSKTLKHDDVMQKFGVKPSQIVDFLSLTGDSSDCVFGAKGIGPKTAAKWLAQHHTLEGVLNAIDLLEPKSRAEMLKSCIDQVKLAKTMISLRSSLSIKPINELLLRPSMYNLKHFLEKIGLQELIGRVEAALSSVL